MRTIVWRALIALSLSLGTTRAAVFNGTVSDIGIIWIGKFCYQGSPTPSIAGSLAVDVAGMRPVCARLPAGMPFNFTAVLVAVVTNLIIAIAGTTGRGASIGTHSVRGFRRL